MPGMIGGSGRAVKPAFEAAGAGPGPCGRAALNSPSVARACEAWKLASAHFFHKRRYATAGRIQGLTGFPGPNSGAGGIPSAAFDAVARGRFRGGPRYSAGPSCEDGGAVKRAFQGPSRRGRVGDGGPRPTSALTGRYGPTSGRSRLATAVHARQAPGPSPCSPGTAFGTGRVGAGAAADVGLPGAGAGWRLRGRTGRAGRRQGRGRASRLATAAAALGERVCLARGLQTNRLAFEGAAGFPARPAGPGAGPVAWSGPRYSAGPACEGGAVRRSISARTSPCRSRAASVA